VSAVASFAAVTEFLKLEAIARTTRFLELHRKHWPGWEGESEIRQMFDASDFAAGGN